MCSHLFIFPQRLPTDSFFPHLPHLFIFSLLFNFYHFFFLFFFYTKASALSPSFTIWFFLLAFSLKLSASLHFLISSMAPKSKKTSHMLSSNAFNFTCWSGAVRLMEPPLLTYRPENQSSFGKCPSQIGEFSNFSHFWVFLWSFVLIYFLTYKCLSFVVGWV